MDDNEDSGLDVALFSTNILYLLFKLMNRSRIEIIDGVYFIKLKLKLKSELLNFFPT